jgi:predicted PurR-regulated permease PerM
VEARADLPSVTSPKDTPQEIDEQSENRSGSRSRRQIPKPLRFFPHIFPVPTTLYGIITVVGGALLVVALFMEVREIFSPFLLMAAIALLFYPFRREPKLRPIVVVAGAVFLCWFVTVAIGVLLPFVLAFLFAYMAEPLVTWLSRRWYVRRWISALTLTLLFVALIIVAVGFMAPVMMTQVGSAVASIGKVTQAGIEWAHDGGLRDIVGVPQEKIDAMLKQYVIPKLGQIDTMLLGMAESAGKSAPSYFSAIMHFLMVPFVMFYFIKDYWKIRGSLYSFLPQEYQRRSQRLLKDLDEIVGGYLRGDVITSVFQGLFIGVGLHIIGVPGALLLGVLTGFLCLIPFIGAYIAFALAALAALSTPEPGITVLYVAGLFVAQGVIEGTVIGPQVMGRHTDLHPILVIISLLVFGFFMGIGGMLIAIPVTSLVVRFATRWRDGRRAQIEQEKVMADLKNNPHHARRGELGEIEAARS